MSIRLRAAVNHTDVLDALPKLILNDMMVPVGKHPFCNHFWPQSLDDSELFGEQFLVIVTLEPSRSEAVFRFRSEKNLERFLLVSDANYLTLTAEQRGALVGHLYQITQFHFSSSSISISDNHVSIYYHKINKNLIELIDIKNHTLLVGRLKYY